MKTASKITGTQQLRYLEQTNSEEDEVSLGQQWPSPTGGICSSPIWSEVQAAQDKVQQV